MSLLDELLAGEPTRDLAGPNCQIVQIRHDEGLDRYLDVIDVLMAPHYSVADKAAVLARHGYDVHHQKITRHSRKRLLGLNGCVGCRRTLEIEAPDRLAQETPGDEG